MTSFEHKGKTIQIDKMKDVALSYWMCTFKYDVNNYVLYGKEALSDERFYAIKEKYGIKHK